MEKRKPKFGKFVLDSLSVGMYNHPLLVIREYVQNCTDSLDEYLKTNCNSDSKGEIEVVINGTDKVLEIIDNGIGIQADLAERVLHDIGRSTKKLDQFRGFRGIGRLGGLGYCKTLQFITKSKGEKIQSISTWDCHKLKDLICQENSLDAAEIIQDVTSLRQEEYKGSHNDHFFKVRLIDLASSRDILLNVPLIKSYLSEVVPVPFNFSAFNFSDEIDSELRGRVPGYETYHITVNGEEIYKPYKNSVLLRGDHRERIQNIDYIMLGDENNPLAYGWIADLSLKGSIALSSLVDGIRVRSGNILIGDKNLLSDFYRERRFNNYLLGELHIISDNLIPNSRRDDFEDNLTREEFFDQFVRKIGLPFSKEIRIRSLNRSKTNNESKADDIYKKAEWVIEHGYLSVNQMELISNKLISFKNSGAYSDNIDKLLAQLCCSQHILDRNGNGLSIEKKDDLKNIIDIVFEECSNDLDAEKIANKILNV